MNLWSVYGGLIVGWIWLSVTQYAGPWHTILGYTALGLGLWTFVEYGSHRWILHHRWGSKLMMRTMVATYHLEHHKAPDDPNKLFITLQASLPLYIAFYGLFYLCTDGWHAGMLVTGLSLGYLAYEGLHSMAHHAVPHTALGRGIKRYHLIHHYAEPDRAFGVTSPVWDIILRTRPKRRAPVVSLRKRNRLLTGRR
jgi:dihydroceramide fatty acyl 2-hydroxylase